MTFTYRSVKGSLLTAAEVDANFLEVETLHDATEGYKDSASASASAASASELAAADSETVALAAANYDGAWTAKSYTVPASVSHLGALWVLEEAAASTDIPGTSTKWTFWSLTEYPIEVNPTLDLDFENQVYKSYEDHSGLTEWSLNGVDSKLTFTRATTKTYFDAKGIMQTASAGEIAIDYDPATGECNGFQPEGPATNLLEHSEDFSNAAWNKIRTSIGGDAVVVPDGSSVVCKLIEDTTATNSHFIFQNKTVVADTNYCVSAFVKADTREKIRLVFQDATTAADGWIYCDFDLTSGSKETAVGANGGVVVDSGIDFIGDGWYRCWVSGKINTTDTDGRFGIYLSDGTASYTGDGTSGLYVWGAQLEAAEAPSSYIPTTTEEATRAADEMSMEGTDFSEWYRQGVGTFVVEFNNVITNRAASFWEVSDGTFDNSYQLYKTAAGLFRFYQAANFVDISTPVVGSTKIAVATSGTAQSISEGGGAIVVDNEDTQFAADRLTIGMTRAGLQQPNTTIKRLTYYPKRLTNTQLIALTRS